MAVINIKLRDIGIHIPIWNYPQSGYGRAYKDGTH